MFKQFTIAFAAAGLALMSGSAIAADKDNPQAPAATAQPTSATATDTKTRYCVKVPASTGTILTRRVCKTMSDWRAIGVEVAKRAN